MKKKILCLAMSMIMAVGALTGCGGKAKSNNTYRNNSMGI